MASETQIGQLVIDLKIKTEALEKGLETAKKKLEQIESQNKQVENCNKSLDASFILMSASIVASLVKIKSAIDDGVQKYKEYESANKGLESIVKGQGLSFSNSQAFIEDYISDGLIPLSDATLAYKNLASRGYNEEQIKQTMIALKDAAAFGRQSTYEYGEAIATATEGLKNENSVLVDNAGVTKNVAKMWQDYAKSIGRTTESLTQAEKIEAEVKGIREESKNQIGDAAKYAETYAGQQAQVNAVNIELSKTIGESMIPALTQYSSLQLSITKSLTKFTSNHKTATSATITFTTALLATIITVTSVKKAINAYTTATGVANEATKALTASVMSNPLFIGGLILSTVIAGYSAYCTKAQETAEAQEKFNKVTEKYNQIKEGTYKYAENSANDLEIERQNIEKQLQYKEKELQLKEREKELAGIVNQSIFDEGFDIKKVIEADKELRNVQNELRNVQNEYNNNVKESENYGNSIDELNDKLKTNKKGIEEANASQKIRSALEVESIKTQQKEAAQLKISVQEMQDYLNIVKQGNKSTSQYQDAVKALASAYPEAANAEGIMIDKAQDYINAEQAKADQAWNTSQETINGNIAVINTYIEMARAAENDTQKQTELANKIGISYQNIIPTLTSVLNILQAMGGYSPTQVPNVTPTSVSRKSYSGSSSYSNKALDNYKKEIEHKKALDQLSIQQEISMYEYALKKYAKTADERNEIREKIYSLNKELAQKEKELLEQQTEDYEAYIQQQKNLRGSAYDVTQQTNDYNKIIQMHRNYLNQIMKDERLSLDERKQIYREELQTIRDYEQQKRDLRVEQIDNTVSQLTNAITKQLEEMQEKDKEFIDKQIEEVEKLKEIRINAINAEYDAKIEAINKELEALDKAEQQKSRDEEDAEYEKKKKRLEDLIDFEHDATTKANYQKELDKLIAEYQKTLDSRALEDKKEALNAQKDLLQEEQDNKVQAVEDEVEKQKEVYNKQLTDLEEYYNKQVDMAQETAENMLLNVEQNQNQIISLLKSYGNAYEITGQSLGEKLAQGINEGLASKIENIIARIQNSIDAGIEAQIAKIASSVYKYEAGTNKPQTKTITITQQNYIEQNPEMPSETYRKLNNVSQKLAEEFAGM